MLIDTDVLERGSISLRSPRFSTSRSTGGASYRGWCILRVVHVSGPTTLSFSLWSYMNGRMSLMSSWSSDDVSAVAISNRLACTVYCGRSYCSDGTSPLPLLPRPWYSPLPFTLMLRLRWYSCLCDQLLCLTYYVPQSGLVGSRAGVFSATALPSDSHIQA